LFDISLFSFSDFLLRFDYVHLIFRIAKLEAQKLMASQIGSHTEYYIPIFGRFFKLKFDLKSSSINVFSIRFNDNSEVAYFLLGHPVCAATS